MTLVNHQTIFSIIPPHHRVTAEVSCRLPYHDTLKMSPLSPTLLTGVQETKLDPNCIMTTGKYAIRTEETFEISEEFISRQLDTFAENFSHLIFQSPTLKSSLSKNFHIFRPPTKLSTIRQERISTWDWIMNELAPFLVTISVSTMLALLAIGAYHQRQQLLNCCGRRERPRRESGLERLDSGRHSRRGGRRGLRSNDLELHHIDPNDRTTATDAELHESGDLPGYLGGEQNGANLLLDHDLGAGNTDTNSLKNSPEKNEDSARQGNQGEAEEGRERETDTYSCAESEESARPKNLAGSSEPIPSGSSPGGTRYWAGNGIGDSVVSNGLGDSDSEDEPDAHHASGGSRTSEHEPRSRKRKRRFHLLIPPLVNPFFDIDQQQQPRGRARGTEP